MLQNKINVSIKSDYRFNTMEMDTLSREATVFVLRFLQPSQPNWVMLSTVSLPNHTFTGQV